MDLAYFFFYIEFLQPLKKNPLTKAHEVKLR